MPPLESLKPDYQEINRLEIEFGIVPPPDKYTPGEVIPHSDVPGYVYHYKPKTFKEANELCKERIRETCKSYKSKPFDASLHIRKEENLKSHPQSASVMASICKDIWTEDLIKSRWRVDEVKIEYNIPNLTRYWLRRETLWVAVDIYNVALNFSNMRAVDKAIESEFDDAMQQLNKMEQDYPNMNNYQRSWQAYNCTLDS